MENRCIQCGKYWSNECLADTCSEDCEKALEREARANDILYETWLENQYEAFLNRKSE